MIRPRGQTGFAPAKAKTNALLDVRPTAGVRPTAKALAYVADDRGWGLKQMVPHAPFADLAATSRQRAVAQAEAERHCFAGEIADVASEDLAVTGIFWVGVRRSA